MYPCVPRHFRPRVQLNLDLHTSLRSPSCDPDTNWPKLYILRRSEPASIQYTLVLFKKLTIAGPVSQTHNSTSISRQGPSQVTPLVTLLGDTPHSQVSSQAELNSAFHYPTLICIRSTGEATEGRRSQDVHEKFV